MATIRVDNVERCDREARARDMVKRREAAQLYYGDFAAAGVGEGEQG